VVVIAVDQCEAVSYRVQTGGLRADVAVGRDISAVNDLCEAVERWILEFVFDDDRIEAAAPIDVALVRPP